MFTKEQIRKANQVDLPTYLQRHNIALIKQGKEYRLKENHSVTVRGNVWYEHDGQYGGKAIDFLEIFMGMRFPEAVAALLHDAGIPAIQIVQKEKEQVPFELPKRSKTMRCLFAYLLKERCISEDVVKTFVSRHDIYETDPYHEIVFVGKNEAGEAVSAQTKSTWSSKYPVMTVRGSDSNYAWSYTGYDTHLYLFEACLDMMSWISEHEDWKEHHYIGNHGLSEHALLQYLKTHEIDHVHIATDHDLAGTYAYMRLTDILKETYPDMDVTRELSVYKDFNEDRKAKFGKEVKPAVDSIGLPYVQRLQKELPFTKGTTRDLLDTYFNSGLMNDGEPDLKYIEEMLSRCMYLYAELNEDETKQGEDTQDQIWRSFKAYRCQGTMKTHKNRIKHTIQDLKRLLYIKAYENEPERLRTLYEDLSHQQMGAIIRIQDEELYPKQEMKQEMQYE